MGREYSTTHAAALLAQLPPGARTWAAYSATGGWTRDQVLLGALVDGVNLLVWSKTKDAQHRRNKPESVLPREKTGDRRVKGLAMDPDELQEALRRIRKGAVADGE